MKKLLVILTVLPFVLMQGGCAPEVGSDAWCEDMAEKPKGDWSANDAAEFAKSCVFKTYGEESN
jgi:hypothetical protein